MTCKTASTDPEDLYVQDRLLAVAPFDRVEFARTFEHRICYVDGIRIHYVVGGRDRSFCSATAGRLRGSNGAR